MQRVFFALWPNEKVAQALHEAGRAAQKTCGGRLMRRDTLHMTLVFLGEVNAEQLDAACAAADSVAGQPFEMVVDRSDCWRHNHIVWAGCLRTPPPLADLADVLGRRLRDGGLSLEERLLVAHATLLRNANCAAVPPPFAPIAWNVAEFVLVESRPAADGPHYRILRRWALG
jgi:2'-5' RNA ligase